MKQSGRSCLLLVLFLGIGGFAAVADELPKKIDQFVPETALVTVYLPKPERSLNSLQKFIEAAGLRNLGLGDSQLILDMLSTGRFSGLKDFINLQNPMVFTVANTNQAYLVVTPINSFNLVTAATNAKLKAVSVGAFVVLHDPDTAVPKFPIARYQNLIWAYKSARASVAWRFGNLNSANNFNIPAQFWPILSESVHSLILSEHFAELDTAFGLAGFDSRLTKFSLSSRDIRSTRTQLGDFLAEGFAQIAIGNRLPAESSQIFLSKVFGLPTVIPTVLGKWQSYFPTVQYWTLNLVKKSANANGPTRDFVLSSVAKYQEILVGIRQIGRDLVRRLSQQSGGGQLRLVEVPQKLADGTIAAHLMLEANNAAVAGSLKDWLGSSGLGQVYVYQSGKTVLVASGKEVLEQYKNSLGQAKWAQLAGFDQILKVLPVDAPIIARLSPADIIGNLSMDQFAKSLLEFIPGVVVSAKVQAGQVRLIALLSAKEAAATISSSLNRKLNRPK